MVIIAGKFQLAYEGIRGVPLFLLLGVFKPDMVNIDQFPE